MVASEHTKLISCIIGFCKKHESWVTPLETYEVVLIEQTLSSDQRTKSVPDLVVQSNKHSSVILFECKSGSTLTEDQINRYGNLRINDLHKWLDIIHDNIDLDTCIAGLVEHGDRLKQINNKRFPIIVFDFPQHQIRKIEGVFNNQHANNEFDTNIDITNKIPTLGYYPFSADDDETTIRHHVIRMMIIALRHKKTARDLKLDEPDSYINEFLLNRIHYCWEAISHREQKRLKDKILSIIRRLIDDNIRSRIVEYQRTMSRNMCDSIVETLTNRGIGDRSMDEFIDNKE